MDTLVPVFKIRKLELRKLNELLHFQNRPSRSPWTHGQGAGSHTHYSPQIKMCSSSKPQEEEKDNCPGVACSCRFGAHPTARVPAARLRVPTRLPAGHAEVATDVLPCVGCVWGLKPSQSTVPMQLLGSRKTAPLLSHLVLQTSFNLCYNSRELLPVFPH